MMKLISGSIRNKLIVIFLATSLVPLVILGALSYASSRAALQKQITSDFDAISQGKEQAVNQYLLGAKRALMVYSHSSTIIDSLIKINENAADAPEAMKAISAYIEARLKLNPLVQEFLVMDKNGRIVASTNAKELGDDKSQDTYFTGAREKDFFIKSTYISGTTGRIGYAASAPVTDFKKGMFQGVFAERMNLESLNNILADRVGMGESGENYVVDKDGLMITESRHEKDVILKQKIDTAPIKFFRTNEKNMTGVYSDYRGTLTLGASSGEILKKEFPYLDWVVMSEIDASEAFLPIKKLLIGIVVVMAIAIVLVILVASSASNSIVTPILTLSNAASNIAKGDLTTAITTKSDDEIGVLAESFKTMMQSLNSIISNMRNAVSQIMSASSEILAASQQQAAGAREQSAAVSETTSAARELSKSAEQVGDSIKRVSEVATHALTGMAKIKEAIGKTGEIITSLSEKSQKIGKITEVIDDVADQTNLLAVNAAIEAARAGEQGRGFTVVADEIRKLADSTAKSTKDITALIEIIQHEMSNAIMSMETSVNSVDEEAKLSQESADRSKEISMSTGQQVAGSKQIADAMVNIDDAMKQVAIGAQQSQVAVKQLTELGKELGKISEKFKVS